MENSDKNALLFKSLAALSRKSAFNEISISALCIRAGVSRMYFYRHFDTFDDIITQRINDDFLYFLRLIDHQNINNPEAIIKTFFQVLEPDLPELSTFLKSDRADLIQTIFQNDLNELSKVEALPFPKNQNPYWKVFTSGGLTRILVTWFGKDKPESANEMGKLVSEIVTNPL